MQQTALKALRSRCEYIRELGKKQLGMRNHFDRLEEPKFLRPQQKELLAELMGKSNDVAN